MNDLFVRLMSPMDLEEYAKCKTFVEKSQSNLVTKMRNCDGVSVFVLSGDVTLDRVVAAVTAPRQSPGRVSYVVFGNYVIVPIATYGTTSDKGVNENHREFHDMDECELVDLADFMIQGAADEIMESNDIRAACRSSISAGYLKESDVCFNIDG